MQPLCSSWPEFDLQPVDVPLLQLTPPPFQVARQQRAAPGSGSSSNQLKGVAVMTATPPRPYLPSLTSPTTCQQHP